MLLSGPPSTLIFVQPLVEVNAVVDASAAEFDVRNAKLLEERDANTQVCGCLVLAEKPCFGKAQRVAGCVIGFHAAGASWRNSRRTR
jgi:hypothetical protein